MPNLLPSLFMNITAGAIRRLRRLPQKATLRQLLAVLRKSLSLNPCVLAVTIRDVRRGVDWGTWGAGIPVLK